MSRGLYNYYVLIVYFGAIPQPSHAASNISNIPAIIKSIPKISIIFIYLPFFS